MIPAVRIPGWAWALAAALLLLAAPTGQSLWIDEATLVLLARAPDAHHFAQALAGTTTSEALMPLATAYFWAVEKIVGDGEWALRLANLPWLWLGVGCLALAGRRIGAPWLPLLFALSPFVWQQADDIRPYAMQLGAGCWLALGCVQLLQSEGRGRRGLWNFGLAAAALTASSLLGVFTVAAAGAVLVTAAVRTRWRPSSAQAAVIAGLGALNIALLLYLGLHLLHGATGTKAWAVTMLNPVFALYELLGFSSLGPGRQLIREAAKAGGIGAVWPILLPTLPGLAILAALYLLAAGSLRRLLADRRRGVALACLAVAALGGVLLGAAAVAVHFPFWGRHLAPALPFFLVFLAALLAATRRPVLTGVFLAVLLGASLNQRLNPAYLKDDYRTAVALAEQAVGQGKRVCWIAAEGPALYYGLPLSAAWPPTAGTVSTGIPAPDRAPPDLLIVSKPDLSDPGDRRLPWIEPGQASLTRPCSTFLFYSRSPTR